MGRFRKSTQVIATPLTWMLIFSGSIYPLLGQARFDRGMALRLESEVAGLLVRTLVPGASVAIVQHNQVVYAQGFGAREQGKPGRVTPETLMMIGSTGKSMTTMMMATLVDQGKIRWDTPVKEIYPDFALSDPALTRKITLRDMVCNCTGMQRHDLEMQFPKRPTTPEGVIRALRSFGFTGEFGKTFGYVNQMVAAGGFIAAWADRRPGLSLYENYLFEMQRSVFDPIGMRSTTFSFDRALAHPDRATPHGQTGGGEYIPISLDMEKAVEPYAPAGASWSNARDAAQYLITQLNQGVAPDGKRVVSAENLSETWKPQVEIQPGTYYGLGWMSGTYRGQRLLSHSGGTWGFTSELAFLPDTGLGIVVLTNAENAGLLAATIRSRIIDLVSGQPADPRYSTMLEESRKRFDEVRAAVRPVDLGFGAKYLGRYWNDSLGEVKLEMNGAKSMLDISGFPTELRTSGDGTYLFWDPPLVGASIRFSTDAHGRPTFVLNAESLDILEKYTFVRSK